MTAVPSPSMVIFWSLDTAGGGMTIAARFGRLGRRVAMVDQSDRMYGGTRVNAGCVHTKALVHEAETRRGAPMTRGAGTPARLARWARGCAVGRTNRKVWSD
jgi:pyruvate/2-oxoglutarate dehydrogenase complex dihydrolipoamide dehydrogenase (E3) component